ncbi:MAG TPA: 1-acyl-sn-glycerol-3-phosphate acyltransferase [Anaerolineae bacterium]|nr:1-acyl-sn-glycerol-3-phosphate acyltransferase [Anaerolineae bacterium]HID84489.1 1-acyl-sn-glycerol-3-phosphate acyltransferase [Anaerolineales bacterium]HIQ08727.1 1-acyl-sn-glycerol-3-phosphate acyltransferase [Anaerolineaceae bacterium]
MTATLRRRALHRFLGTLFRWLTRVEVEGWVRIPHQGGALLAVNHLSRLDPPLIFVLCERHDLTALVAEKYRHWPIIRQMVDTVDGIWINRFAPDAQALRRALRHLRGGGMLGIAPEGTRSKTGGLMRGKPGVVYLAALSGVPIVPIAIYGTERWWHQWLRCRRPVIFVRVGEPFVVGRLPDENRDAWLQEKADEVMLRIAALLPPEYRGVYARHPRLREFLQPDKEEP